METEMYVEQQEDRDETDLMLEQEGSHLDQAELPESVQKAEAGPMEPGEEELDATEWFMASDSPTEDEIEPTVLKVNVGTAENKRIIRWSIVPLPDSEFRKFRRAALPRASRRGGGVGVGDVDDGKYHLLVVCAATVDPDLREIARRKGVGDPAEVVRHRLAHKPGLIAQISGYVSDISGYDEGDLEVAAGN